MLLFNKNITIHFFEPGIITFLIFRCVALLYVPVMNELFLPHRNIPLSFQLYFLCVPMFLLCLYGKYFALFNLLTTVQECDATVDPKRTFAGPIIVLKTYCVI